MATSMIPFSYTNGPSFFDTPDSVVFDPTYAYMTGLGRTWCRFMASIMAASALSFTVSYTKVRRGNRCFHGLLIAMHMISAYTYMLMSDGNDFVKVPAHYALAKGLPVRVPGIDEYFERQVSWARYVDWSIAAPIIIICLLLTTRAHPVIIGITILFSTAMSVTFCQAALQSPPIKWTLVLVAISLRIATALLFIFLGHYSATALDHRRATKTFHYCLAATCVVWFFYPFVWLLCEGHNSLSVDAETIIYSVLDIIAKPVFGLLLLSGHQDIDPAVLGLDVFIHNGWPFAGVLEEEHNAALQVVVVKQNSRGKNNRQNKQGKNNRNSRR